MQVGDLVQLRHGTVGLLAGWSIDDSEPNMYLRVWHVLVEDALVLDIHEVYGMMKVINESR